jgi:hypothetical protein
VGAKPKPKTAEVVATPFISSPEPAPRSARLASAEDLGGESPARRLQDQLRESLSPPAPTQWSARKTVAFVALTCGSFWIAAALLFQLSLRALG